MTAEETPSISPKRLQTPKACFSKKNKTYFILMNDFWFLDKVNNFQAFIPNEKWHNCCTNFFKYRNRYYYCSIIFGTQNLPH